MANTVAIIKDNGSFAEAAIFADEYVNGGKNDWHLPSGEELFELHWQTSRGNVSGLAADIYWSSTDTDNGFAAKYYNFGNGNTWKAGWNTGKHNYFRVRPVRAF